LCPRELQIAKMASLGPCQPPFSPYAADAETGTLPAERSDMLDPNLMSVANNRRGIVNGRWEPCTPNPSIRLAVACLEGAKLLKKAAMDAAARVAPRRRASKAIVTCRGAW